MSSSFASVVIIVVNNNINKMHHIIALHFSTHIFIADCINNNTSIRRHVV